MVIKTKEDRISPSIVPIDNETAGMLDYAERATTKMKIEQARDELARGQGIAAAPDYFTDLSHRIAHRVSGKSERRSA